MSASYVAGPVDNQQSKESKLFTVPYTAVSITDGFLANYQQVNRTVSLAHGFHMLEKAVQEEGWGNYFDITNARGKVISVNDFVGDMVKV